MARDGWIILKKSWLYQKEEYWLIVWKNSPEIRNLKNIWKLM